MKLPLALRSGQHTVKVSRPGFADYLDTFEMQPGQDLVLEIDLLATTGVLRIEALVPGAEIFVDGEPLGAAPFEGDLEPGARVIQVRAAGHAPHRETLQVEAGEIYADEVTLTPLPAQASDPDDERSAWYGHWWVWAGASAVVAGGVVAALVLAGGEDTPAGPDHTVPLEMAP